MFMFWGHLLLSFRYHLEDGSVWVTVEAVS